MNQTTMNRLRIGVMVLAVIGIGVNILIYGRPRSEPIEIAPRRIAQPKSTTREKVTNRFSPNPDFTKKQMGDVLRYAEIYKQKYGCYPVMGSGKSLNDDITDRFKEYGFTGIMESMRAFENRDTWLSDSDVHSKMNPNYFINPYIFPARPDGTSKCSAKTGAGRDMIAYTNIYVHMNHKIHANGTTSFQPTGYYLVLWEDGSVEQVPWQNARFGKAELASPIPMFPGQYGIEKFDTVSMGEKYKASTASK